MTWGHASNAACRGLSATDFRALLRSNESPATSGPAPNTATGQRFAGVLALTRIEVMSAALEGMRKSDPRRQTLASAIYSARSAILHRGPQC